MFSARVIGIHWWDVQKKKKKVLIKYFQKDNVKIPLSGAT